MVETKFQAQLAYNFNSNQSMMNWLSKIQGMWEV
jgi:hypothetical protein